MKTLALLLFITSSYSQADTENRFEVTIIQEYPFGWGCVEPAHPEDAKAALQEKADNDCGYQRPQISTTLIIPGSESGGGGDGDPGIRVWEIRADILSWIERGGSKGLDLNRANVTLEEYNTEMTKLLQPQFVVIGFVKEDHATIEELQVKVNGNPKACRGFKSTNDKKYHILCNSKELMAETEAGQYRLIHHEYAGLARLEKNDGPASDYEISSQLTDYLKEERVLKLALKKQEASEINQQEDAIEVLLEHPELLIEARKKGKIYIPDYMPICFDSLKFKDFNVKYFNEHDIYPPAVLTPEQEKKFRFAVMEESKNIINESNRKIKLIEKDISEGKYSGQTLKQAQQEIIQIKQQSEQYLDQRLTPQQPQTCYKASIYTFEETCIGLKKEIVWKLKYDFILEDSGSCIGSLNHRIPKVNVTLNEKTN